MKAVSKIAWCAGGVALLACLGLALHRQSTPRAHSAPSVSNAPSNPTNPDAVAYTPSQFPGVMVRHVPQTRRLEEGDSPAAAVIGKRRGVKRPAGPVNVPRVGVRDPADGIAVRSGRGVTRFGGNWMAMPSNRVPVITGRRDKNGKIHVE